MALKNQRVIYKKISEAQLRIALARKLLLEYRAEQPIFANEARYGFADRRADFVMVNECSHAFEIKSDFDTTLSLEDQLSEYVATFDFVTVVTTQLHLKKVRAIAPKNVGLLILEDGTFMQKRAAKQNRRLSKQHLVASVTRGSLIQAVPELRKNAGLAGVQLGAVKMMAASQLRNLFIDELRKRFSETSNQFIGETDSEPHEEDLLLLRRISRLAV